MTSRNFIILVGTRKDDWQSTESTYGDLFLSPRGFKSTVKVFKEMVTFAKMKTPELNKLASIANSSTCNAVHKIGAQLIFIAWPCWKD